MVGAPWRRTRQPRPPARRSRGATDAATAPSSCCRRAPLVAPHLTSPGPTRSQGLCSGSLPPTVSLSQPQPGRPLLGAYRHVVAPLCVRTAARALVGRAMELPRAGAPPHLVSTAPHRAAPRRTAPRRTAPPRHRDAVTRHCRWTEASARNGASVLRARVATPCCCAGASPI